MVRISEDLIRKRSEHNNCEITTLEEISLHQCDIERIEYMDKWCRDLKILYLQSNLIPRIESVGRLKKLEYLNLALNNIEVVENLQGCESLNKLDLTVNFVGRVTSVESLKHNQFLRELFLTGNPCTEYIGYRDYIIATLPQLSSLDGTPVTRSERIEATQRLTELRCDMLRQEKRYLDKRDKEKEIEEIETVGVKKEKLTEEEFWSQPSKFTPESRVEAHRFMEEKRKEKEESSKSNFPDLNPAKRVIRFFNEEGRPLNINQDKIDFTFTENDDFTAYVLNVACYKHMDTSLIDADLQPNYVRVTMKEKILQLSLNDEISTDQSTAQRSQTTGHLVITMPKLKYILEGKCSRNSKTATTTKKSQPLKTDQSDAANGKSQTGNQTKSTILQTTHQTKNTDGTTATTKQIERSVERLEVSSDKDVNGNTKKKCDYANIVKDNQSHDVVNDDDSFIFTGKRRMNGGLKGVGDDIIEDDDFIDDPDVPPLE